MVRDHRGREWSVATYTFTTFIVYSVILVRFQGGSCKFIQLSGYPFIQKSRHFHNCFTNILGFKNNNFC